MSLFLLFNQIWGAFGVAGTGQVGSLSIPGSIAVSLFSDDAGVPGSLIALLGIFPDTAIPSGDSVLHITLPTPLQLPAGRYWIQLSGNQLSGVRWIQAGDDTGSGVATELWSKTSAGTITSGANVTGPSYQMDVYGDQGFGSVAGTGTAAQLLAAPSLVVGVSGTGAASSFGGGTFSRASSATYIDPVGIVQTVGNNVLRYQSGVPLIEPASTNLATYSTDLSNVISWATQDSTVLQNNAVAPDGTQTAAFLREDSANAGHTIYGSSAVTWASGTWYALSIFAKAGTRHILGLNGLGLLGAGLAPQWDLTAGTDITTGTNANFYHGIVACTNGWYRCWVVWKSTNTTNIQWIIQNASGTTTYTGDGVSGLYVWGGQIEVVTGTAPTSFIYTTSAQVTRAADTISTAGIEAIAETLTGVAGVGLADGQPSLDLSFMAQTLDSRITFSRTLSTATYFDSSGTLQTASANAPRFDYDPVTLTYRGLLIETGRTNSIRNNTMQGAAAGSPGTLPTNWFTSNLSGLTRTVVGTGTDSGIPYIDVRYNGTTTGTAFDLNFEASTAIAASNGQTWSMSAYLKLAAGSLTNVTSQTLVQQYYDSGLSFVGGSTQSFTPIGSSLVSQRNQFVNTIANANTATILPYIKFNCSSGVAIDITIRVGAPQLELGQGVTSPILTSGSTVTRGTDNAAMPAGDWYNSSTGTMAVEAIDECSSGNNFWATLNDTTNQNEIRIFVNGTFLNNTILTSNTQYYSYNNAAPNVQYGVVNRAAFAWTSSTASTAWNGTVFNTASVTGPLPVVTNLQIGSRTANVFTANAWFREVRYWPLALSSTDLIAATSGQAVGEPFDSVSATITGVAGTGRVRADTETVEYDFMRGALDPSLTFTRTSTAYYFDGTGTLQAASSGVSRFEYDPVTLLLRGLLIEESRTNSIRNPRAEGYVAGTFGSGGSLPTNWSFALSPTGLTITIIGTGFENGIPYFDIRAQGTPTSNSFLSVNAESNTQIAALQNQAWTGTVYVKLQAGSLTNITSGQMVVIERDSGGANLNSAGTSGLIPTTAPLGQVRWTNTYTLPDATAAFVSLRIDLGNFSSGNAVDVTYRIGAPQLERGQMATSVILPTVGSPAATTRNQEVLANNSIGGFYNTATSTMAVEAMFTWATAPSTVFPGLAQFDDGTVNNRFELYMQPSTTQVRFGDNYTSNLNDIIITTGNATSGTVFKVAASISSTTAAAVLNGGTVQTAIPAHFPGASLTRLTIGVVSGNWFNGYIQRFRYWNSVISNTALQLATTSESALPQVSGVINGVSASGQAGTATPSQPAVNQPVTGVSTTGQVGTFSIEIDKTLTGVSGTTAAASLSIEVDDTISLTGAAGTGAPGLLATTISGTFALGVRANGLTGQWSPVVATAYTRNSIATYYNSSGVLTTAGVNVIRTDNYDPATLVDTGLLVEAASTNYCLQGTTVATSNWGTFGGTATANATTSPDGTSNAELFTQNSANSEHYDQQTNVASGILIAGQQATFSVYVKSNGVRYVGLHFFDNAAAGSAVFAVFDLTAVSSAVSNNGTTTGGTASITAINNGWYRISTTAVVSGVHNSASGFIARISHHSAFSTGAFSFTGDGVSGLYLYGAQVEFGTLTSFIPTTTTTVTRAADVQDWPVTISANVTGVTATGQPGNVAFIDSGIVTGVAGTSQVGALTASISGSVSGIAATGQVGSTIAADADTIVGTSGTGVAGTARDSISIVAPDIQSTGAAGSLTVSETVTAPGIAGSGQAGTLRAQEAPSITGASGAGQVGTAIAQVSVAAAGISCTGQAGALSVTDTKAITGVSSTGQIGTAVAQTAVAAADVSATGQSGTLSTQLAHTLSGISATGSTGTVSKEVDVTTIGVSAIGQTGSPIAREAGVITGTSASGGIGALTAQIAHTALGVAATGQTGITRVTIDAALASASATSSPGVLTSEVDHALIGVAAIAQIGAVARQIADSLFGVLGSCVAGQVVAEVQAELSGDVGTGEVGNVSFEIDESPRIIGVSGMGAVGDTSLAGVSIHPSNPLYDNIGDLDTLAAVSLANTAIAASFSTGQAGGYLTTVRILLHAPGEGFALEGSGMIKLEDDGGVLVLEED